jgi:capsular polysaccharide biosynthesis protein
MTLLLGLTAATLGSVGAAFVADYLDPAFRTPQQLGECLRMPVLAALPKEIA